MHYLVKINVSVLKATVENKMTSITTHFKKLTTGNDVFILSYYLNLSNCGILQLLHHMFSMSALLLDDPVLKCVVTDVN